MSPSTPAAAPSARSKSRIAPDGGTLHRGWFAEPGNLPWALALFAVAYFAAICLGHAFYIDPTAVSTFWPASGLLVGALAVSRARLWPALVLIAIVVKPTASALFLEAFAQADALTNVARTSIFYQAAFVLVEVVEALVAATLLRRFFGPNFSLRRLQELLGFAVVAMVSTALAALPGAATVSKGLGQATFWSAWQTWWLADAMGVLLIAPLVIEFSERVMDWLARLRGWALLEVIAIPGLIVALGLPVEHAVLVQFPILSAPEWIILLLVWAALRFRSWAAAACVVLNAVLVVWKTDMGLGPFAAADLTAQQAVLGIQVYLVVSTLTVLVISVVLQERAAAEVARNQSSARYRTLFNSATDGVVVARAGRFIDCNDRILDTLGFSREELIGKAPWEISPPTQPDGQDSKKLARRLIRDAITTGEAPAFDWRHLAADGREIDFEVGVSAAEVIDGETTVIGHLRDITKRKRAEEEIEDRLRFETLISELSARFINVAPQAIDDLIVEAQRALVEHLGLDRSTVTQRFGDDVELTHFWARDDVPEPPQLDDPLREMPYLFQRMAEGKKVIAPRLADLPQQAAGVREILGSQGLTALFAYPLRVGSTTLGHLSFGSFQENRTFSPELIRRLQLAADVLASALARTRTEAALRESEARFRAVFENSRAGLVIRKLEDHSLVAVNPALAHMFGYTVAEYAELAPGDVLGAESIPRLTEMAQAVRNGQSYQFAAAVGFRKDGSAIECETSYVPLSLEGEPHALGIVRDITEQKRAQEALKASEEKFFKAFDTSPDALSITTLEEGRILDVNQGFLRTTGYRRSEVLGKTTVELDLWVDPSDRDQLLRSVAANDDSTGLRCRLRMKSGEQRTGKLSGVRMDVGGESRLLTVVRDVTEQEQARNALKQSEEKFYKAFHASPTAAVLTDLTSGNVQEVNDAMVRTFGYDRHELIGRTTEELGAWIEPDDRRRVIEMLQAGTPVRAMETRMRHKDGSEVAIEFSAVLIEIDGRPTLYSIANDVTQRKLEERRRDEALGEIARLKDELEQERDYLREEIVVARRFGDIVGESPALHRTLSQIEAVAATDTAVLIRGESGVGKELVARAIHLQSARRDGPLVRVNCASVPDNLFESEFFGHVKGAFTGAHRDRIGRFQLAHKGTLFLDEVTEIPLDLQPKLLRALQEGEIQRVGEDGARQVNVRVIAASNLDIEQAMAEGRFREDLFYRLNVFPLSVPPLRERGEDAVLIARHFVSEICRQLGREPMQLSRFQAQKLVRYSWPGNIRELRNVIEKAIILSRGSRLKLDLDGSDPPSGEDLRTPTDEPPFLTQSQWEERERANLAAALEAAGWKVSGPGGAAELLGLRPSTLSSKIKAMGLRKPT